MRPAKNTKVNSSIVEKELEKVDKLFADLAKDKSLPTFGEHYMQCLTLGIAEHVNLKQMYPKAYFKLSKWLAEHSKRIIKLQNSTDKNGKFK